MTDEQVLKSVFPIYGSGEGTCFLYGDARHVLTAKHVVVTSTGAIADKIEIKSGEQTYRSVHCQALEFCDVALVELDADLPGMPLEPVSEPADPTPGTKIRAAGFPVQFEERWQPGELVGRRKLGEYEIRYEHSLIGQLSGLSGAPVLDPERRVVGVILQHDQVTVSAGKMAPLIDFREALDFSVHGAGISWIAIFSDSEPPADGILRSAVLEAKEILAVDQIIDFQQYSATECVSSKESYSDIVRRLCRADVCIFDLTNYEPASMLLLGIRSVVKRGITIGSTSSGIENAPYDIKDLSLLDHKEATTRGLKLRNVIVNRVRAGQAAQSLQHYLDLPTFDAVRNLPPGRRSEIPHKERVLLLCSYAAGAEGNFGYVQDRLQFELQKRKIERPNVSRVIDLNAESPWMVSQNMYEAIRRTKLCVVDWSGPPAWPANVFFELGVRIAVRDSGTFCVLESASPDLTGQKQNLIALFQPVRYQRPQKDAFAPLMNVWDQYEKGQGNAAGPCEYTFREITGSIDARQGLVSQAVTMDLLQSAQLLSADDTEALSGVLYPKNRDLNIAAGKAVKERLWAAWYYATTRYTVSEIAKDPDLFPAVKDIVRGLITALGASDPQLTPVKDMLKRVLEAQK